MQQMEMNLESTIKANHESDREFVESHSEGIECSYCEKKRERVDCAMSIDNEFDYCCVVCNLEYLNWKRKGAYPKYKNKRLIKRYDEALRSDKENNDVEWKSHLKTITERSETYERENIERKEK